MKLIDADALKKAIETQMGYDYERKIIFDFVNLPDLIKIIDNTPTIIPSEIQAMMSDYLVYKNESERPHGEWVNTLVGLPSEPVTKCSLCGYDITFAIADLVKSESGVCCIKDYKPNFCPNCGAKMSN